MDFRGILDGFLGGDAFRDAWRFSDRFRGFFEILGKIILGFLKHDQSEMNEWK